MTTKLLLALALVGVTGCQTHKIAPTVLWPNEVWQAEAEKRKQDHPGTIQYGPFEFSAEASGKRYEFGLRSDGCVVWRERK